MLLKQLWPISARTRDQWARSVASSTGSSMVPVTLAGVKNTGMWGVLRFREHLRLSCWWMVDGWWIQTQGFLAPPCCPCSVWQIWNYSTTEILVRFSFLNISWLYTISKYKKKRHAAFTQWSLYRSFTHSHTTNLKSTSMPIKAS